MLLIAHSLGTQKSTTSPPLLFSLFIGCNQQALSLGELPSLIVIETGGARGGEVIRRSPDGRPTFTLAARLRLNIIDFLDLKIL